MPSSINRRDILKLSALLPLGLTAPLLARALSSSQAGPAGQQNVIVVVFDALSASNLALHGYQRQTTPNLARLADRAIVYHNHFAGSNFTTSGTASLLTGTLPWTHRALQNEGEVAPAFESRNMFGLFRDYFRIAYTHNDWAYTLLRQVRSEIDDLVPPSKLFYSSFYSFIQTIFDNDRDIAAVSWARDMKLTDGYAYSILLSTPYGALEEKKVEKVAPAFPRGLPSAGAGDTFLLEQAVDWVGNELPRVPQPFLGYYHFYPPHAPYNTSLEFFRDFREDGLTPIQKPTDVFAVPPQPRQLQWRTEYDEFILYADEQFGRLFDSLDASGLLDNSWVLFTSDHGEMFERGIRAHATETLYQPVIHIPLLIFEPGRRSRVDIQMNTSAVDVLPTLAHLTGHAVPDWSEGILLPPFDTRDPDLNRSVYVVRAIKTAQDEPLTRASIALIRGRYKLLYYVGYPDYGVDELAKLYDLQADPEELVDLYTSQALLAAEMLSELKSKLQEVNQPYL